MNLFNEIHIAVHITALDDYLKEQVLDRVDFIKLDVEGAELDVLKGAKGVLGNKPRPIILCEVYDSRTAPWGYPARRICELLEAQSFSWHGITPQGTLFPFPKRVRYASNLVAVPRERLRELGSLVVSGEVAIHATC